MPTSYNLTGNYHKGPSSPSYGQLSIYPTVRSKHSDGTILSVDEIVVDLVDGGFSVALFATDDVGWDPAFQWVVRERIIDGVAIEIGPFNLTADTDISTIT